MKVSGDEFLETALKFRKRKKNYSSYVYILHETSHQEISYGISRPSHVMQVQSCPIAFLTLSEYRRRCVECEYDFVNPVRML